MFDSRAIFSTYPKGYSCAIVHPSVFPKVCPNELEPSRLSRELGAEIFSINFHGSTRKQWQLVPLQFETQPTDAVGFTCLLGKDRGRML